jgi:hypothetical protein
MKQVGWFTRLLDFCMRRNRCFCGEIATETAWWSEAYCPIWCDAHANAAAKSFVLDKYGTTNLELRPKERP